MHELQTNQTRVLGQVVLGRARDGDVAAGHLVRRLLHGLWTSVVPCAYPKAAAAVDVVATNDVDLDVDVGK